MNQHPYLTPSTEVNLKWVIDLNVIAKNIKFPKEKAQEKYLYDVREWFGKTQKPENIKTIRYNQN